jgi:hypothetical protein
MMFWYVTGYNLLSGLERHKHYREKGKSYTFKSGTRVNLDLKNDSGYIIVSGEIRCDFQTNTNQSLSLIALQIGECFGNLKPADYSNVALIATGNTNLLELPFNEMLEVARLSDAISLSFYKGLLQKRTIINISPDSLIFKPAKLRVEEALKLLAGRIGVHQKNGILIKLRPTSERLAKMVGLGRLHTLLSIADLYNQHKVIPDLRTLILPF